MIKRHIIAALLVFILAIGLVLLNVCLPYENEGKGDKPVILTQKANDDFTNLFRLVQTRGDSLIHLEITEIEEVSELIEKYELTDTYYTRMRAKVINDFARRTSDSEITVYALGNAENFPSREVLTVGNQYILRLEHWVHESGIIYLINPLESTFLRVHDSKVLVRERADTPNYSPACTINEFADKFGAYRTENPANGDVLKAHFKEVLTTLENYNYEQKELVYRPTTQAIAARKLLAEKKAK